MNVYGKIGGFSFTLAFFLQLITTPVVNNYLQHAGGNRNEVSFELHHLIVSSIVVLTITCLISRKFCEEQIHQV